MNVAVTNRIDDLLDEYVLLSELAEEPRAARSFHASGLLNCARQQVYDILGYPKQPTLQRARWIRSREVGSLIHRHYTELFLGAQVLLAEEMTIPPNAYDIGGRIDEALWLANRQIIVDIKTVGHAKWLKMPKGEDFAANYAQLQLYLHFLDLNEGILLYVNRSDNETKEFTILRDQPCIAALLQRAAGLKYRKDHRIIPHEERSYKCVYCPFQAVCKEDGPDEFALAS